MKECYADVQCDNVNVNERFLYVDAWRTMDQNEEGKLIAAIHQETGDVFYVEPVARYSPLAQRVIMAKVAEIKEETFDQQLERILQLNFALERTESSVRAMCRDYAYKKLADADEEHPKNVKIMLDLPEYDTSPLENPCITEAWQDGPDELYFSESGMSYPLELGQYPTLAIIQIVKQL